MRLLYILLARNLNVQNQRREGQYTYSSTAKLLRRLTCQFGIFTRRLPLLFAIFNNRGANGYAKRWWAMVRMRFAEVSMLRKLSVSPGNCCLSILRDCGSEKAVLWEKQEKGG